MSEKTITVVSNLKQAKDGSWPLALFEKDERHPSGEVFIKGDKPIEVFPTAEVVAAIRGEKIRVIDGAVSTSDADQTAQQVSDSARDAGAEKGDGTPDTGASSTGTASADASTTTGSKK